MIARPTFVALQANYLSQLRELEAQSVHDADEAQAMRERLAALNRLYLESAPPSEMTIEPIEHEQQALDREAFNKNEKA